MKDKRLMRNLEERLQQWAEWNTRGNSFNLGYPTCSLEYRLMTEGVVVRSPGLPRIPINEAVEEVEKWIVEMALYNKNMATALRHYYFYQGSLRDKAKLLHISHMQFKYQVDMAHQWLAGRLSRKKIE